MSSPVFLDTERTIKKKKRGGEMNQALYAHMNNKRKMKKKQ
jgi:hypothetical protein